MILDTAGNPLPTKEQQSEQEQRVDRAKLHVEAVFAALQALESEHPPMSVEEMKHLIFNLFINWARNLPGQLFPQEIGSLNFAMNSFLKDVAPAKKAEAALFEQAKKANPQGMPS